MGMESEGVMSASTAAQRRLEQEAMEEGDSRAGRRGGENNSVCANVHDTLSTPLAENEM